MVRGVQSKPIPLIEPDFGKQEEEELRETIRSGWIAEGQRTKKFEQQVVNFLKVKYAASVPNGTLALTLACMAGGVGLGDEVIIPALTMAGTANGILLAGGIPVLADVRAADLTIDPVEVQKKISNDTRAIMPVHFNGRAADMEALLKLAKKHNLVVIEDAAQGFGSRLLGKKLGTIGQMGCFSFSVPKVVTTGQGGMVVTNSKLLYEKLIKIKDQGRRKRGTDIHDLIGFNFRFTDLQAAVGIAQIRKARRNLDRKRRIYSFYKKHLENVGKVEFIETNLEQTIPWFMDILVPGRDSLANYLKGNGIGTMPFYPVMNRHRAYQKISGFSGTFPNARRAAEEGLWLPSSVNLTESQILRVCGLIKAFYADEAN